MTRARFNFFSPRLPAALAGLLSTLSAVPLLAADAASANYVAFELRREDSWAPLQTRDLNGDGRKDLVYSHSDPQRGRELWIHYQRSDGSFPAEPYRLEIKTEIIAVGFADLRDTPGEELLLFADRGVFSLTAATESYAGNLKPLLQWPLLATVPDRERVYLIDTLPDINADGQVDLVLPGDQEYGVFLGAPGESFTQSSVFDVINQELPPGQRRAAQPDLEARLAINAEEGVVVELTVERQGPFADFVRPARRSDADTEQADLLDIENWIPTVLLRRLNDDDLLDAVYLTLGADGLGQINVHFQQSDGAFPPQPDWTGSLDTRGQVILKDFDGDGLVDITRISDDGDDWRVYLYQNTANNGPGIFDFATPSQILRFNGYDLNLDFVRLRAGSPPVLSASFYTVPVVDAIRNASVTRNQLLYAADSSEGAVFSRRPDIRMEENFDASNVRGLSEPLTLSYDVDGNGEKDALFITENGTLAARALGADLSLADDPFWEYVSERSVFEFEVLALNDDSNPDLLLRHGNSMTVLVAAPASSSGASATSTSGQD